MSVEKCGKGVGKCVGGDGVCGKVCWGVGKVREDVGKCGGGVGKCVGGSGVASGSTARGGSKNCGPK